MANKDNLKKGNEEHKFTKENQPDPKAKSRGWKKKMLLKEISEQIVTGDAVEDLKPLAQYLGIAENEIDVETLMHLSQINKAIKEQDTKAYNAVMDRLKGRPKQEIDHKNNGNDFNSPLLQFDPIKQTEKDNE